MVYGDRLRGASPQRLSHDHHLRLTRGSHAVATTNQRRLAQLGWVPLLYVCAAAMVVAYGLLHHEMWRDEMEAWLVARDSHGLRQLIDNLRYEQQFLWILLLKLVVPFGVGPHAMQVLHWLLAVANVFLVVRFSPFSLPVRGLISFSYFFVFEYAVISRVYALGLFLLLVSCTVVLQARRERTRAWLGVLTLMMALVIIHYWVIAACLMVSLGIEWFVSRKTTTNDTLWMVATIGISVVGLALPFVIFRLPADSNIRLFEEPWTWNSARDAAAFVMNAFLPIQTPRLPFWDVHWLPQLALFERIRRGLAVLLIACFGLSFLRRPGVFFFYGASTLALVLIFVGFYPGWLRHHGLVVIVLVAALWLEPAFSQVTLHRWLERLADYARSVRAIVFPSLLVGQCLAAAMALRMDAAFPFSPAQATAQLIVDRGLETAPIVGDPPFVIQTVLGYLPGDRQAYYPSIDRMGSFPRWDRTKAAPVDRNRLIAVARSQRADRVVILLGYRQVGQWPNGERITHLGFFPASMAMGEQYDVYLWERSMSSEVATAARNHRGPVS